jgi:hypothetical protein
VSILQIKRSERILIYSGLFEGYNLTYGGAAAGENNQSFVAIYKIGYLQQMKIQQNKNIGILVLLILGIILSACSPKDKLLGVWQEQGGDLHLRIHTGNVLSQRVFFDDTVLSLSGSYEILNSSQIRIEFQEGDWEGLKSGLYDYSISGDQLILDGKTFERLPDIYES